MTVVNAGADHSTGSSPQIVVSVSYNGLTKEFEVQSTQTVQSLLSRAISAFGIQNQPHLLSLFTVAGVELRDHDSIGVSGVKSGDQLLLRPGAVKGGS